MVNNPNYIRSSSQFISIKSGNWNDPTCWRLLGLDGLYYDVPYLPEFGNDTTIQISHTISLTKNEFSNSLTINGTLTYNGFTVTTNVSFDDDALAYLTATNITDPTKRTSWNNFVKSLKTNSIWNKMTEIGPIAGGYSGSNIKLKVGPSAPTGTTLNGFVSGDYSETIGLTGDGSTKSIDTGLVFSNTALTTQNFTFGYYCRTNYSLGIPMGTSSASVYMTYGSSLGGSEVSTVGSNQPYHYATDGHVSIVGNSSNVKTYSGGIVHNSTGAAGLSSLPGNLQVFSYVGSFRFTGAISLYYVASALTQSEMTILDTAIKTLHVGIGRRSTNRNVFIGDSTTYGTAATTPSNNWTSLVNASIGGFEVNVGISSTVFQNTAVGGLAADNGYNRFNGAVLGQNPTKVYILYGLNDLRYNDVAFTATTFQTQLEQRIQDCLNSGITASNITIGSPPYNDPSKFASASAPFNAGSVLKQQQWRDACFNAAQNKGVKYADVYQDMLDNGGISLLDADGIHPNDSGYLRIANKMLSATFV